MNLDRLSPFLRSVVAALNPARIFRLAKQLIRYVLEGLSRSKPFMRILIIVAIAFVTIIAVSYIFGTIFIYFFARSYVEAIADAWNINSNLTNALFWIVFAGTIVLASHVFSRSRTKRTIGISGVLILLIGQYVIIWHGTSGKFFDRRGVATKCYVVTRDAVTYGERAGIDPATGRECKPVTPEVVERLAAYQEGKRARRIQTDEPVFFDLRTGNPVVWFYKRSDGRVELFDLMGFHPETGDELLPVTKQIVELWKDRKQQEARRPPARIDVDKSPPFDPLTGKAQVWYRQNENGDFEFYDRPGFHPQTGEALKAISSEVLNEWRERSLKKCYIITRDAVLYRRSDPGIDRETGRQCRSITAQVLERLHEYEKGKRPKIIEIGTPEFFDPRTGEAIIWYSKGANDNIELFDLMGFHPQTGEELLPITKDVVDLWRKKKLRGVPKRVDPRNYEFFDVLTGEPKAWYWRNDKGEYEFYDNPGFHPMTGEPLSPVSKEVLASWIEALKAREQKLKEEQERIRQEKTRREDENRREAMRLEEERQRRQAEREKLQRYAKRCDDLAANPTDPRRVTNGGVPYSLLKAQANEAIEACELATQQYPHELRFQYQYGRAMQIRDRKRALQIQRRLAELNYPAAFDNAGWLMISEHNNYLEAVKLFRMGVQLGDPDCMVSLAEMIDKGRAIPLGPSETKTALYSRAAQLGHENAAQALKAEQENDRRAEEQRIMQAEQQRRAIELFGQILQSFPRR